MFWLFLAAFYFILIPSPSLVSDSTRHWNIAPDLRTEEGLLVSCSDQWPASPPLSRPHLSKLQTVQRAMEQTSHYAIITSTTLNTLSTLIIGLHLECQVLFFKSDGCLTFNRDWSANENSWTKQASKGHCELKIDRKTYFINFLLNSWRILFLSWRKWHYITH